MKEILEKILGAGVREIVKLHGDASYRAYYRAFLDNGETRIVMQLPLGKQSASEEITNFNGTHKELPFINIQRFLSSLSLPVPAIHEYDDKNRLMILEDLGDGLLAKYVKDASPPEQEKWYKKAIDLLIKIQKLTTPHPYPSPLRGEGGGGGCIVFQRSFDATLLNWEFDHFREYLIEARLGKTMEPSDRKLFEDATRKITAEIIKMPYAFTHRDFQSRNLIVRSDGSLAMIDFQDALMGPSVYDLVALLRDSYVELEWGLVEKLIGYYCQQVKNIPLTLTLPLEGGGNREGVTIYSPFHLVTLQRKMKDAGRFVYIDRVKKNPNFLQHIPASLRYIKNAFDQTNLPAGRHGALTCLPAGTAHQRTNELFEMLKNYVPEFKSF